MMMVPDNAAIDAFRGIAVGMGVLLVAALVGLRFTRGLPARTRGVLYALILLALPPLATEIQQLGKPFIVWRLPLTVLAYVTGLRWAVRVHLELGDDGAVL